MENTNYTAKVVFATKDLTAKEKIMLKDIGNAAQLDVLTSEAGTPVVIDIDYFALVQVHNEKSDNKDYTKCVIVDKAGNKFVTGSDSFIRKLTDIHEELVDAGETEMTIEAYRQESKNYKGKQFLSCSLV